MSAASADSWLLKRRITFSITQFYRSRYGSARTCIGDIRPGTQRPAHTNLAMAILFLERRTRYQPEIRRDAVDLRRVDRPAWWPLNSRSANEASVVGVDCSSQAAARGS